MGRRIRTTVAAFAAALTLLLSQAIPAQASVLVKAGAGTTCTHFKPASITIAKGTKVVWKAVCGNHTLKAYSKNWSKFATLNLGQTTSRVFKTKGVFKYYCTIHGFLSNGVCSGMCGKVTVGT
jgi:plastocyanin